MYYRDFEGFDDIRRGSFVELSGRLLEKNKSESSAFSKQVLDNYDWRYLSPGHTEPFETEVDLKKVSFVSKANELFLNSIEPRNSRSEPVIKNKPATMENQRKISTQTSGSWPPTYYQPMELPRFEQPEPPPLPQHQPTKREAELESAVKILSMKLDYTQRKIMESQNNKEILKAKLDHLINNLAKAGYDPNFKPEIKRAFNKITTEIDYADKEIEDSKNRKEILKAELDYYVNEASFEPHTQVPPRPIGGAPALHRPPPANVEKYNQHFRPTSPHSGQIQTYRPDQRKMSHTSWTKLKELADEYERRIMLIKSLEEQEKYVKSQLTTPVNITVPSIMGAPRAGPDHLR